MRETETRWRALLEHWPGHILTIDGENRLTSISRSSATIDAAQDLGRDLFDFVASEEQAELRADLALTRAGEPAAVRRRLRRLPDGPPRWYDTHLMPIEELGVMIVTNNVTQEEEARRALGEREQMAARLGLLADASQEFSEVTGDYDRLLDVIARRLGELLGDLCTIRAVSEDGKMLERGAVYHRDPETVAQAHDLLAAHPQAVGEGVTGRVAASGQSLFIPSTSSAEYIASTVPQYRPILERLNVGSVMMVPMSCREQVIGVATLFRTGSEHPYTEDDLNLVRNLADHAALAIANARSYAAEHAAADAALRANQALHDSVVAHRLLFEASPIPVIVFDVETLGYLAVNEAALCLYGFPRDEMLEMKVSHLRFPSEAAAVKGAVAALGEAPAQGTVRHRRKDGSLFLAEYDSRMLIFGGRRARIAVIRDVTARHEGEERRSLLAAIVESSNDAIISKRLDGTITSWNTAAERLFGYSAAEALGQPIGLVIPPDRMVEERALLGRVAAGEHIEHYETMRQRKDGTAVEVSISLAPILDDSGQVLGASKTARDLTAQRKGEAVLRNAEDQLRQAQKMDAVGRLAGGIAHDFNNMLSVIMSYSGLLLAELKPTDSTRDEIEEIHTAALRAAELTRHLLMFSRQQIVAPRVLALNELLAGTEKMVRRIVGEDIDFITVPAPVLGRVRADPGQIEQVIMNLVVNARDAMPTGGQLSIETGNVELDSDYAREHWGVTPGPHVMLAVSDTGVGMDQATQSRIFEPFFTTKEVGKGTGLGLSTVFGIAQQSGGSVWVYSEPGAGTTFKVYFPRVEADLEIARPPAPVPATRRGSETILLVEDQEQVRAVAASILRRNGYRVILAPSAGDALLLAEKHRGDIHLLLTDVVMPQISGVELARRIAPLRPELKVLFMSGYTDDSIVRHGVLDGRMAFLEKPFTPESLTRKLREILTSGVN